MAMSSAGLIVDLKQLSKHFGTHAALDRIDLQLGGGEIVGVVGPDGAGKTTLIRSLAGLLEIEAERAMVLGYDLHADVTEMKNDIGYVPQAFSLHRELSVIENLRFTGRLLRLPKNVFEARADALLKRTSLSPFVDRPAGALSGGMKQKLAVANALLVQPKLLLLDEPTAGVDVLARGEIWNLLEAARSHALVVMSTSYLDEAEACDRLLYLDDGRIIGNGTPAQLRGAVPLELYHAWGDDPRGIARAARQLPFVLAARPTGSFARVEIARAQSPGESQVIAALSQLGPGAVSFVEAAPIDMEATLLHLAREHGQ
jgi:ABC-2 type transport system ATP-binding protein